jgi:hypothetical protein
MSPQADKMASDTQARCNQAAEQTNLLLLLCPNNTSISHRHPGLMDVHLVVVKLLFRQVEDTHGLVGAPLQRLAECNHAESKRAGKLEQTVSQERKCLYKHSLQVEI